jgi:hypothetical protein
LISFGKKFILFFLRENQPSDESTKVKASLEGCTKKIKHHSTQEGLDLENVHRLQIFEQHHPQELVTLYPRSTIY